MTKNVIINKCEIIERCVKRIEEIYAKSAKNFESNFDMQDALILNLQRACEASIDLAMHLVRINHLGIPKNSRDAFQILIDSKIISRPLGERLIKKVGFRNIAVHNYQEVDILLVKKIATEHLGDFKDFSSKSIQLN